MMLIAIQYLIKKRVLELVFELQAHNAEIRDDF